MQPMIFHEKKPHGTPDFPVEYHLVDTGHPRFGMSTHWHKEWELIRVVEGTLRLRVDEVLYSACPGDVILVRDGMLHGGVQEPCLYECLLFDLRELFKGFEPIKEQIRPVYRMDQLPQIFFSCEQHPEVCQCAARLMACCTPPPRPEGEAGYDRLSLVGCMCELYGRILRDGLVLQSTELPRPHTHRTDSIKTVLEFIEQHYAGAITLSNLAARAGMAPNYFCRVFKEVMHQSPMDYVLHYRIEQAAGLLAGTLMPVTAVSMECGFNDHSYFIRTFRRLKGVTPKQYRMRYPGKRG